MMWQEIMIAACLMLVIEGMLPFIAPQRWRAMVQGMLSMNDQTIRRIGFASMMMGVMLLYLIN